MASLVPAPAPGPQLHVEAVNGLPSLADAGFRISQVSPPYSAPNHENLPGPLKGQPGLTGENLICFTGAPARPPQYIEKPFSALQNTAPAFFYIKYYAHVDSDLERVGGATTVFLRPTLTADDARQGGNVWTLPLTHDFEWVEEIVELDIETASKRADENNGFEFGIFDFEDTDYWVVDRFAILQGVEDPGYPRFYEEFERLFPVLGVDALREQELYQQSVQEQEQQQQASRPTFRERISSAVLQPLISGCRSCFSCFRKSNNNYGNL